MTRVMGSVLLTGLLMVSAAQAGGEIFGTIQTRDGRELTGPIRWDKNENYWNDVLDALKPMVLEKPEEPSGFSMSLFGHKIGDEDSRSYNSFSIPFGHLSSIEPLGIMEVSLTLRSGEQIEVRAGSSDLGMGMRGLLIDDPAEGRVSLSWGQVKRIEFRQGGSQTLDAERLYGLVESKAGSFEGFIVWDRDEAMLEDILDGEDEREEYELPFRDITVIERQGRSSSRITLRDGRILELGGTNDVAEGHRGVAVAVDGIGILELNWRDVERVTFQEPPPSPRYGQFDGGGKIHGAVSTQDGRLLSGQIVWDRDESYTWESLDGAQDGIDYAIQFSQIASVRPVNRAASKVVLRSGKVLRLSSSDDVSHGNRGLIVSTPGGSEIELEWEAVRLIVF